MTSWGSVRSIGKYTTEYHNITVHQWGEGYVEIGAFCSIGRDVHIILGGRHNSRAVSTYAFGYMHRDVFPVSPPDPFTEKPNVIIGNDVWIGREVSIMRGVTIGDGAVVAARSHVVENVRPYEVVGGNPARHIKWRFTPEETTALLSVKWWELPDEDIKAILPLLTSGNIWIFVEAINRIRGV
jgi:acetyltransferase-like isoleucine patch superfamily enzyme